ncbi:MAG: hypothetical protein ABIA21_02095 [Candidatus Aenigmatarchaeota archaeon]
MSDPVIDFAEFFGSHHKKIMKACTKFLGPNFFEKCVLNQSTSGPDKLRYAINKPGGGPYSKICKEVYRVQPDENIVIIDNKHNIRIKNVGEGSVFLVSSDGEIERVITSITPKLYVVENRQMIYEKIENRGIEPTYLAMFRRL